MLFFYIRHGDPIYDPDSLTPLGQKQAEALAKRLALYGIDKIYASSSTRAQMTAKPTADLTHKPITTLDWCHESKAAEEFFVIEEGFCSWVYNHPAYKRLFSSQRIQKLGMDWAQDPAFAGTRLASGMERIHRETDAFFASLGYHHDRENRLYTCEKDSDERVALFAHEGFSMAFLSSLLDIPYPEFSTRFFISHSSMTVIDFSLKDGFVIPRVLTYSNDSHLYREGLPTKHCNVIAY